MAAFSAKSCPVEWLGRGRKVNAVGWTPSRKGLTGMGPAVRGGEEKLYPGHTSTSREARAC